MNPSFKIIISMICFGSIGLFVKNINLPSMEIAFLRAIIASGIFITYNLIAKKTSLKNYSRKNILLLIISGVAIGFNWVLLFQAYKFTTIPNATLSYYFAPVFVIILSPFVLKEKLTPRKFMSVIGAMAGLFLILNSGGSNISNITYNHTKGIIYGLSAAVLYAFVILINNYIKGLSGFDRTMIQLSSSTIVLLPFVLYRGQLSIEGSLSLAFILILGIVHTAIGYLLYFSGLKDINVQSAAVLSYIDPISALLFSSFFLRETMGALQLLGGALILLSTFIAENNKSLKRKKISAIEKTEYNS